MSRLQQVQKFLKEQLEPRWAERLTTPQKGESIEDFVKRQEEFRDSAIREFDIGLKHTKVSPLDVSLMLAVPGPFDEILYLGGREMVGDLVDDKVKRMRDDSIASDIAARSKASRQDMNKRTRRDPSLGSFDPLANTREDMVDLAKQIDRRKAEEEADKKERIRKETEQLLGPRNLGTSNIGFKFTVESFAPKSLKRLQKVQNFLAEQYDESNISNHYSMHVEHDPETNHPYLRSGTLRGRINNIRAGSLAAAVRKLLTRSAEEGTPTRITRTQKLSPEEIQAVKTRVQTRRAQSHDPRTSGQYASGSNMINPGDEQSRAFYKSMAQKRQTMAEEVIGRIGPQDSSALSSLFTQKIARDESTPEGEERMNRDISRLRKLIHVRIKSKMEDAARKFGSASIRTSEMHGNPHDIQAHHDLLHAQHQLDRHNKQLDRFVNAHDALAQTGAREKFLTGDQMRRLTVLSANLTKKRVNQLQQAVNAAQVQGEADEVF